MFGLFDQALSFLISFNLMLAAAFHFLRRTKAQGSFISFHRQEILRVALILHLESRLEMENLKLLYQATLDKLSLNAKLRSENEIDRVDP